MSALEQLVRTPAAQALGVALAHSVWQGAAAALGLTTALRLTRSARIRYAAGCAALMLLLVLFAVTFAVSIPDGAPAVRLTPLGVFRQFPGAAGDPVAPPDPSGWLPWLAPFWAAGVLVFQLRAAAGWTTARRLRTTGVCAAPEYWRTRLGELRDRIRTSRPVTLLESSLARTPAVAGHLRPVILMPVGLLAGLPVAHVEAILLHELAHVRRRDYLVNLLQTWVESLFFYHPAAWWISRVIRAEREHCCDDLAAAAQGDTHQYATALAALEQYRWSAEPAVAATGGDLMKRIRRLLRSEGPRPAFGPIFAATLLAVAAAAALVAWQGRPAPSPQSETASPYTKWVQEDVAYIISDRERAAFVALTTNEEREKFIEQFWQRRDPTPGTPANEYKEEHYRRIGYSNERFGDGKVSGWKTDRGRIYIVYGPPDELESHPTGAPTLTYPYEEWRYKWIEGIGTNVIVRFEDPKRSGEYRMTTDPRTIRK